MLQDAPGINDELLYVAQLGTEGTVLELLFGARFGASDSLRDKNKV